MSGVGMAGLSRSLFLLSSLVVILFMHVGRVHAQGGGCGEGTVLHSAQFRSLNEWKPFSLPGVERGSEYTVSDESSGRVLNISSRQGASGIIWDEVIDLHNVGSIQWTARVMWMPKQCDLSERDLDDSPLRLMILFSSDRDDVVELTPQGKRNKIPLFSLVQSKSDCNLLVYAASDGRHEQGEAMNSPYSRYIKIVPWTVENGAAWQTVHMNPLRDYLHAFMKTPPRWGRLALVSDTDNTGGDAAVKVRSIEFCSE